MEAGQWEINSLFPQFCRIPLSALDEWFLEIDPLCPRPDTADLTSASITPNVVCFQPAEAFALLQPIGNHSVLNKQIEGYDLQRIFMCRFKNYRAPGTGLLHL